MFCFIDSRRFLNSTEEKLANEVGNRTEGKYGAFNKDDKAKGNRELCGQNFSMTSLL